MMDVIIVDEHDRPVGRKQRSDLHYGDIYRVSAAWITDLATGDCLLTQRKLTLSHDPGKWMSAAAGTVAADESYGENIVHEIQEEIGLTDLELTTGPKEYVDNGQHRYFVQWYYAKIDKNSVTIKIQEDEVEAYAWVPLEALRADIKKNPHKYVPSFQDSLRLV
jgi:isopentenyl-diphosphate delta-isomerase